MEKLSVPEKHQLKIARSTLKMSDAGAFVMGGMTKVEAREVIFKLTGKNLLRAYPDFQEGLYFVVDTESGDVVMSDFNSLEEAERAISSMIGRK